MKDLDYTPDAALAERIREALPNHPRKFKDGEIIAWYVLDGETYKPQVSCKTRDAARELAGDDGEIGKLTREH